MATGRGRHEGGRHEEGWHKVGGRLEASHGCKARSQISITDVSDRSSGACSTIAREPEMHNTHPVTPKTLSRSFNSVCASTALRQQLAAGVSDRSDRRGQDGSTSGNGASLRPSGGRVSGEPPAVALLLRDSLAEALNNSNGQASA